MSNEVEADELLTNKLSFSQQLMDALKQARTEGKVPLVISSSKSPVELIREGRGDLLMAYVDSSLTLSLAEVGESVNWLLL